MNIPSNIPRKLLFGIIFELKLIADGAFLKVKIFLHEFEV